MRPYNRGTAKIRHAKTGKVYTINSDELLWETVESEERNMGPETHYVSDIEHPELGLLTWELWEYPEGVENYQRTNVGEHEIVEDFDYGLEHERE